MNKINASELRGARMECKDCKSGLCTCGHEFGVHAESCPLSAPNMTNASDCKCVDCGEPAVAFWPMADTDIPHYPFCRKCLDKHKMDLLLKLGTANSTRGRKS